jgi:hypothetical protein
MIRPGHRNLVDKMTDHAALQVNCSGQFDPFGEEGALLMNYINNAGPYIAHQIHKELGYGFGHLAIWQGFAEPERLPSATRWFADASDMIACIESLTPLFEVSSLGGCTVESNRKQSIHNMTDLSCMWLLGRPKVSDLGDRYAELRLAPAMPARQGRHVAEVLIDLTEIVLDWFWGLNGGRPVRTLEDAVDLYSFVSDQSCVSEYVPRKPLDEKKWCEMLNEG